MMFMQELAIVISRIEETIHFVCLCLIYDSFVINFMMFKKFEDKKLNANFCVLNAWEINAHNMDPKIEV